MTAQEHDEHKPFPPTRAVLIALTITGFILVFRPFGVTITSLPEYLVVAGFAPLNFAMMLGVHQAPLPSGRIRSVVSIGAIVLGNTAYVSMWDAGANVFGIGFKVFLVAILAVAAIGLWNRQRSLQREVFDLKKNRAKNSAAPLVLKSSDGKEVLCIEPANLLFATARGNYVEVHYLKAGEVMSSLLRATLSGIFDQAPGNTLHRCHRSYLVNIRAAHRIVKDARAMTVEFENAGPVPVSRNYRDVIMNAVRQ